MLAMRTKVQYALQLTINRSNITGWILALLGCCTSMIDFLVRLPECRSLWKASLRLQTQHNDVVCKGGMHGLWHLKLSVLSHVNPTDKSAHRTGPMQGIMQEACQALHF